MTLARRLSRAGVVTVVVCVAALLGVVQLASGALYARAIAPGMPIAHLPAAFGVRVYQLLDRLAPAAYVEDSLATYSLAHGDATAAEHYAVRMPASPRRDQLLARVALARGQNVLASEYFFVADDIDALQQSVATQAQTDIPGAILFERRIRERLIELRTHPDAVANSYWISGNLKASLGRLRPAIADYRHAEALAPLDARFILAVANDAYLVGDLTVARAEFLHGRAVAPGSGNMVCGLGLVALRTGHRARAVAYLRQAMVLDPHAQMIAELERALR